MEVAIDGSRWISNFLTRSLQIEHFDNIRKDCEKYSKTPQTDTQFRFEYFFI